MKKPTIMIIDSGIGGLSYFNALKAYPIDANVIYLADTANFPYGTKSSLELMDVFNNLLITIKHFTPDVLLIACNTASLHSGTFFSDNLNLPVITISPSLTLSLSASSNKKVAILATAASLKSNFFNETILKTLPGSFKAIAATNLVTFIEQHLIAAAQSEKYQAIKPFFDKIVAAECDTALLGCSHFIHLKDTMSHYYPSIKAIDNSDHIAKELFNCLALKQNGTPKKTMDALLYQTSHHPNQSYYRKIASYFGLSYKGIIEA